MKSKFLKKAGAALLSATMLTNTAAFSTFISDAADSTETRYEFEDAEITGVLEAVGDECERIEHPVEGIRSHFDNFVNSRWGERDVLPDYRFTREKTIKIRLVFHG